MTVSLDREALAALCDVFVPAVKPPPALPDDPGGFFASTASSELTHLVVAELLEELLDETELADVATLLKVVRAAGLGRLPWRAGQTILRGLGALDADAAEGLDALRRLTMVAHYGGSGRDGRNPTWVHESYPGPPAAHRTPDPLPLVRPAAGDEELVLEADAVVVGSGAGGGVIAARLAQAGLAVVVAEAGGAYDESSFPGDELGALRSLYWRHGLVTTEDENVTILAGGALGGGTTVNWSNCVQPPDHVLQEWEDAGVDGLTTDLAAHLDAVAGRIGASDAHTEQNGRNQRLLEGAKALGWAAHTTARNVDPALEDSRSTGLTGYGDRSGAKLGTLRTWLPDAVADGARIVANLTVDRVLTEDGRAAGVVGWYDDGRRRVPATIRARTVVVAAGALETPAILLRSGIGGPAVGRHLRLHPVPIVQGVYDEPQEGWSGPPQGVVVSERSATYDGHGYLLEAGAWHPGLTAGAIQWPDARDHKLLMSRTSHMVGFLAVTRERGSGHVQLGADGQGEVHYPLDDQFDIDVMRAAIRDMIRLHEAAGARLIVDLLPSRRLWKRGTPIHDFATAMSEVTLGKDGLGLFSAHQMGSARMGADPRTSVCDASGQLHDTPGVWVGDTSVFPTAVGSNPMLTCMAMAHRTAANIVAAR